MSRIPYVYAVLRAVPRVDRGECVNVGVVLYCQQRDFLAASAHVDVARLLALDAGTDVDGLRDGLRAVQDACAEGSVSTAREGGGRGAVFHWLTAPRSTVLQPGPVHGGVTGDPAGELERLTVRLVR
jgi:hypothetical protein